MLNIFNATESAPSERAVTTPKSSEMASVEGGERMAWFESPLMFIGVVTALLVVVHFVERKLD